MKDSKSTYSNDLKNNSQNLKNYPKINLIKKRIIKNSKNINNNIENPKSKKDENELSNSNEMKI